MKFDDRIKRELTEGVFRALMEDAGYRVIDTGIEKVLRELCCLRKDEYEALQMPSNIRFLPDFTVLDRQQTERFFVDVKFRSQWAKNLFEEASIREQAKLLGDIVIVSFNPSPQDVKSFPAERKYDPPSRYLRCCRLRYHRKAKEYQIEISERTNGSASTDGDKSSAQGTDETLVYKWHDVRAVQDNHYLWWRMSPLQRIFPGLNNGLLESGEPRGDAASKRSIQTAIRALRGILDHPPGKPAGS